MNRLRIVTESATNMSEPAAVAVAAPRPVALGTLKPRNAIGVLFSIGTLTVTLAGFWCAAQGSWPLWLVGQLLVAAALVEWFVLLHECGHRTLFHTRWANTVVGHLAGVFAAISFSIWKRIHGRHHKWTGWQDLDPTTEALTTRERAVWERRVVNICWRYWIPLFSVLYRLNNFWNLPRLMRLFPAVEVRRDIVCGAAAVGVVYTVTLAVFGPVALVQSIGPAIVIALIAEDILILSQHTHIPMEQSHGREVMPHPAQDQERYTRSLRLPQIASRLVLHFDAHELHHMYPFVPGYALHRIGYATMNEVSWWRWIAAARSVPGEVLLFQNRDETGFDL
jgi:omega-6 fatty acid desaturase (delta-12 desaturase)